ncbi:MAG: hypothetical protein AAF639_41520 [Chloroflexota bacterium]
MIFNSITVEVAISLFFIYLLLSLICSAVNEWLSGILQLRAKTLREGIQNLLNDPTSEALAKDFYDHPLITGLSRQRGQQSLPSYITSGTFVRVLLDITGAQGKTDNSRTVLDLYNDIRAKVSTLDKVGSGLENAMMSIVHDSGLDPKQLQQATPMLEQMRNTRMKLDEHCNYNKSSWQWDST